MLAWMVAQFILLGPRQRSAAVAGLRSLAFVVYYVGASLWLMVKNR